LENVDQWNLIKISAIQSRSCPMWFLGFSNHEKGALRQEISKWSMVCSTFLRSGWSIVRSALLSKGGTLKKRPSLHLHKVPTQSSKVNPRTFQMALVHYYYLACLIREHDEERNVWKKDIKSSNISCSNSEIEEDTSFPSLKPEKVFPHNTHQLCFTLFPLSGSETLTIYCRFSTAMATMAEN
jgi:hypothetical protein